MMLIIQIIYISIYYMDNKGSSSESNTNSTRVKVHRPWGWFVNIDGDDHSHYKVKQLCVLPGKRLSLQSHNHRSEHWVLCKGHAQVQLNDELFEMHPNQHIFIPTTALHRLENAGEEIVEIIETQIGNYLGEDDIIRYSDDYGRA
jgi:mannose-1-phosphate guanylyltransferase/mannose-6-phosphate isomerase